MQIVLQYVWGRVQNSAIPTNSGAAYVARLQLPLEYIVEPFGTRGPGE